MAIGAMVEDEDAIGEEDDGGSLIGGVGAGRVIWGVGTCTDCAEGGATKPNFGGMKAS